MPTPPNTLDGWTNHACAEYGDILGRPPSDQEMRQLLRLWKENSAKAFLNSKGRWQVKVEVGSKRLRRKVWLVVGEQQGK
jgi:hypothetical protein